MMIWFSYYWYYYKSKMVCIKSSYPDTFYSVNTLNNASYMPAKDRLWTRTVLSLMCEKNKMVTWISGFSTVIWWKIKIFRLCITQILAHKWESYSNRQNCPSHFFFNIQMLPCDVIKKHLCRNAFKHKYTEFFYTPHTLHNDMDYR